MTRIALATSAAVVSCAKRRFATLTTSASSGRGTVGVSRRRQIAHDVATACVAAPQVPPELPGANLHGDDGDAVAGTDLGRAGVELMAKFVGPASGTPSRSAMASDENGLAKAALNSQAPCCSNSSSNRPAIRAMCVSISLSLRGVNSRIVVIAGRV